MALANDTGTALVARRHLELWRLHRSTRNRARARGELTTAADMLRAMDMGIWRERAEAERTALA